jgi:hypothetical protein
VFLLSAPTDVATHQLRTQLSVEDEHLLRSMMRLNEILIEEMNNRIVEVFGWFESIELIQRKLPSTEMNGDSVRQ